MEHTETKAITVGEWIVTMILLGIPFVNFIMLFVWAFGAATHPSKKTFALAYLIVIAVVIVLAVLILIASAAIGFSVPHTNSN